MVTARKISKDERYTYDDYKTWKDSEDWEIIDGIAYSMAPSPYQEHQEVGGNIYRKIGNYLEGKSCKVYYEWDVLLSDDSIVKPDIMVVCDKTKITRKHIKGAPDLVIEILSKSTMKRDKTIKLEKYKKAGVKEYWLVDPVNCYIVVYYFEKNETAEYIFDEEETENLIPVGIFGNELKLDLKSVFSE